jgi:hypothetical protein
MSITLPTPPEGEVEQLFDGLFYIVTGTSSNQSVEATNDGIFYYPRFGSVCFVKADEPYRSEHINIASASGYVKNPAPHYFDGYLYTPYLLNNQATFTANYRPAP